MTGIVTSVRFFKLRKEVNNKNSQQSKVKILNLREPKIKDEPKRRRVSHNPRESILETCLMEVIVICTTWFFPYIPLSLIYISEMILMFVSRLHSIDLAIRYTREGFEKSQKFKTVGFLQPL